MPLSRVPPLSPRLRPSAAQAVWPGSVSLVVSRGEYLQRMGLGDAIDLIGTPDSISLRVPNSTLTIALLKETGPLAITSAIPSGACDCTHHNKVDAVIASKIDYILADGPSPMTIASSVIDVRNIEEGQLFFYRVGCVPEAYVWRVLRSVSSQPAHLYTAWLPKRHLQSTVSLMNVVTRAIGCDEWSLYLLTSRETRQALERTVLQSQGTLDEFSCHRQAPALPGWKDVALCFESGLHTFGNCSVANHGEHNTLVLPVVQHGHTCAVIAVKGKRDRQMSSGQSEHGGLVDFIPADLHTLSMCAGYLAPLLVAEESQVALTECLVDRLTHHEVYTIDDLQARVDDSTTASEGEAGNGGRV